jgi:hypothetical protein
MTKTATEKTQSPVDSLSSLLGSFASTDNRELLMLAVSVIQAAQRFAARAGNTADTAKLLAAAIADLSHLPWGSVNFPISNTLLSQTYSDIFTENNVRDDDKNRVLLESALAFLDLMRQQPDYAKESVLRSLVSDSAVTQTTPAPPPELNYRANILQIFDPNNVAAVDLEPLHVVVYRGELLGGGFGPELWGLAYIKEETAYVILETGEYVVVPSASLALAATKDYDTSELPPYLMACAKILVPSLFGPLMADDPNSNQVLEKLGKNFGNFSVLPAFEFVAAKNLAECENVIDNARWASNDTRVDGALKSFDLVGNLQIMVTAQQAAIRPYITATLIDKTTGKILMRLDTPREFSARGIYLFPLREKSAALVVV